MVCCLPIVVAAVPLVKSSVYWTYQTDLASQIRFGVLHLCQFVQLLMIFLFAFLRPFKETALTRSRDWAGLLLVLFVVPIACMILIDFWRVRPSSWDSFTWRLADNWNEGRFLGHVRQSVKLLIVTLLVWVWGYAGKWQMTTVGQSSFGIPRSIAINHLMLLTAVVAILVRILVRLGWQWNDDDAVAASQIVPIALTAVSTAIWKGRASSRYWVMASVAALAAWLIVGASFAWYRWSLYNMPIESGRIVLEAVKSYGLWLSLCLIGWLIFHLNGLTLTRPSVTPSPTAV